jgi:hypothetical protein
MSWPAVTPGTLVPPFIAYRGDAWYGVEVGNTSATNAVVADTAYAFPIWLERASPIARITMIVGTSTASVSARLALYDTRHDLPAPGRLLVGSMTEYDMGAAANTVHELMLASPIWHPRGFVWGVSRFNGAAQPRTAQPNPNNGAAGQLFQAMLGAASPLAVHLPNAPNTTCRVTGALAYGAAWPAEFPAPSFGTNAPGSPVIQWRPT